MPRRRTAQAQSTPNQKQRQAEGILAFARYLSWADLLNNLFEAEMTKEPDASDGESFREHEWRWFGLMCYWYASLQVVVEAWDKLGFSDPVIDRLLGHPKQLRRLLRRHRNGVFHFQESLIDSRLVDLLALGAVHVYWVWALHIEFRRFFAEHLSGLMVTNAQREELRAGIEGVIHWYPAREEPTLQSLEDTVDQARALLARHPDDQSKERREVERLVGSAKATLHEGRQSWAALRADMLREAGL